MNTVDFGFEPTHPGEILKEEIECRGLTQKELASQMGISYKVLNDILNSHRPISTTTAMMFEAALDIPAESLVYLQMKYNLLVARQDSKLKERLKQIRRIAAVF